MPREHLVTVAPDVDLWVEERGDASATPVLLVMGAASSGLVWPEALLDRLAGEHRVIRYDHRDTGRSSAAFDRAPYALRDLAADAVAVLEALGVDRAHVVGMSMGGLLTQLLLLDHRERLRSATLVCTGPLDGGPGAAPAGPSPELLAYWATMPEPRDDAAELDWRVEHWLRLNGGGACRDPRQWRAVEARVAAHAGGLRSALPHAMADQSGLDRGAELGSVDVATLVVRAPHDPAYPPANAERLLERIGTRGGRPATAATIAEMGHALGEEVVGAFGDVVLAHLARVEAAAS